MKKIKFIAQSISLLVLIQAAVTAATIYVDNQLADDCHGTYSIANRNSSGSDGDAYTTLRKAMNVTTAGDTVLIRDGEYNEAYAWANTLANSGRADAYITYKGYPGEHAHIKGTWTADSGDQHSASPFYLSDRHYIRFEGFEISNYYIGITMTSNNSNIIIKDLAVHDTIIGINIASNSNDILIEDVSGYRNSMYYDGGATVIMRNSNNITLHNVYAYNNDDLKGSAGDGDGFALIGGSNITFINCTAKHNSEDGFDVTGENVRLINCRTFDNGAVGFKLWNQHGETHPANPSYYLINSQSFHNNETGLTAANGPNVYIYNSVFYNNGEMGLRLLLGTGQNPKAIVHNNIIMKNGYYAPNDNSSNYPSVYVDPGWTDVVFDYNLYYDNWDKDVGYSKEGSHSIRGTDPLCYSTISGNFHLKEGSPAIDKGITLYEVSDDCDGHARPFGSAYDIGADERIEVLGNTAPHFTEPAETQFSINEGELLTINFKAVDSENNTVVYYIEGGDVVSEMNIDQNTGVFSFTPNFNSGGDTINQEKQYVLQIGVTDEYYPYPPDSKQITITVYNINRAPAYSGIEEYTLIEGRRFRIKFPISDPDGSTNIISSLVNLPGSVSYYNSNYIIDWTPTAAQVGIYNSVLNLSDGTDSSQYTISFRVMDDAPYQEPSNENNIFYVDGSNGNNNNDGLTPATAWKTIQKAKNTLTAGQMVLIRGGTYNEYGSVAHSGTLDNPIIFKAYPEETVVMDGAVFSSPEAFNFNSGISNIVIDGITFNNFSETLYLRGNNNNITLFNLTIQDAKIWGIVMAGSLNNNIRIENVAMDGIDDVGISGGGTNIHMYKVSIKDFASRGIDISSSDNLNIINSKIYDSRDNARFGIIVVGNSIYIAGTEVLNVSEFGAYIYRPSNYVYIQNCIFANTRLNPGGSNAFNLAVRPMTQFELYNSVIYNSGQYGLYLYDGFYKTHAVKNCIIYNNPIEVMKPNAFSLNEVYNLFGPGFTPTGSNSISADPLFVNAANYDFSLQGNSPAIDAGVDVGLPYVGNAPDIGAYEWGSTPAEPPEPPEPPIPPLALPEKTELNCYNNVMNPSKGEEAIIHIELDKQAHVQVIIYDNKGKKIKTIIDENKEPGFYPMTWNGKNDAGSTVGSGIYMVHMRAGSYSETKKIAVVK